jgi:HSP20 family protein
MILHNGSYRDLNRLTARVFDSATRTSGARLDAYRDGDTFYIDVDLPGADPAGIDVTVERAVLTVRCERKRVERENVRLVAADRPAGPVSRQVSLAETLDTDRLEARCDDGVLTLSIPVKQAAKPREFAVAELAAA